MVFFFLIPKGNELPEQSAGMFAYRLRYLRREDSLSWSCTNWNEWQRFTPSSISLKIIALRSPQSAFSLSRSATAPSRKEPDLDVEFCIVRDVEVLSLQTIPQSLCDSSLYTREPDFAFCITKSAVAWCFLIKRKAGTIPAILYSYLRIVSAF